ncbi:MAG: PilZ domain-containing protein [Spirochaetales bacterium]|nr:PilZ domain-containing protein [Spirochaetales bacterium]
MANTVMGVEKEFVLESARDSKSALRLHKAGWSGEARIVSVDQDRIDIELRGAAAAVAPWDPVAVYFDYHGTTLSFAAKARKVLEDRVSLEMPIHLVRAPKRRHVRVPAPRGFSASFILANERVKLDYPESGEYVDIAEPDGPAGFDVSSMPSLVASFRQRAQGISSENAIVMWKGRAPESLEERIVARLGKVLYIPSTSTGLPVSDPYPEGRIVTASEEEDFEGPSIFTEGSKLARLLMEKALAGINAEIWCPIRYYQYIVGCVRLVNSGERRIAFDLAAVDLAWEFSRILAFLLHRHDYFKTAATNPPSPRAASLVDLSPSGCLIAVSLASLQIRLQPGTLIDLELKAPGGPASLRGRVARRYDDGRSSYYGIAFEEVREEDAARLHRLLYGKAWDPADDRGESGAAPAAGAAP